MATAEDTQISNTAALLSEALGGRSRVQIIHQLATAQEPVRQYRLAHQLGLSEASISRSKQSLVDAGLVIESDAGLTLPDDVAAGYSDILAYIEANRGVVSNE